MTMELKRNKLWRRQQSMRLFKARMILYAACEHCMFDADGNRIDNPHWFELAKEKWTQVFKTTGTPCSCWMCRGERYNRRDYKKETRCIIKEAVD